MNEPPRNPPSDPPTLPPSPRGKLSELWRRLARAQEVALAEARSRPLRLTDSRPGLLETLTVIQPRRRRLRRAALVASLGVGAAAAVAVMGLPSESSLRFWLPSSSESGAAGQELFTDAQTDLPLRFSDGSVVTFLAGSAGRMQRLTEAGAEVVLERGRVEARVVHAPTTLWLVHAGPFKVRVTGTRFLVGWSARKLEVEVREGSVIVDGAALGAGVPLRAGQRLTVESGVVRTVAVQQGARSAAEEIADFRPPLALSASGSAALPVPGSGAPGDVARSLLRPVLGGEATGRGSATPFGSAAGSANPSGSVSAIVPATVPNIGTWRDADWLLLAERGAYREALAAARAVGWGVLCHRLDPRRLLILGDVARYAGAPADARRAFVALVARFPTDPRAADALFSLGRLAFEAGRVDRAAQMFKRYVNDWPDGPLAEQAAGRLVECALRSDDPETAQHAARAYLDRAPNGPHAALAHEVLRQAPEDASDGSP